jgi:hypothetical protein
MGGVNSEQQEANSQLSIAFLSGYSEVKVSITPENTSTCNPAGCAKHTTGRRM